MDEKNPAEDVLRDQILRSMDIERRSNRYWLIEQWRTSSGEQRTKLIDAVGLSTMLNCAPADVRDAFLKKVSPE